MTTDAILAAGTLLTAPVPADPEAPAVAPREAALPVLESARELGQWIPAADILPEPFEDVLITNGEAGHWWPAAVDLDGIWRLSSTGTRLPDHFVTHWFAVPSLEGNAPSFPTSKP